MLLHWLFFAIAQACLCFVSVTHRSRNSLIPKRQWLQDLVTWDQHSLIVRGERVMIYSGEFHPFRLPSPGLWLDVFQKIKALGFTGVSFYADWGLLEGNPGHVVTDGVFSLDQFFAAASEAGIYLIARPGPYINAETAAGGMPGWTLRLNGTLRSTAPDYLNATVHYLSVIGKIIADAQITNGGPVIMVQPENEYSTWPGESFAQFPELFNRELMTFTEDRLRDAGIVVPFAINDNENMGYFAPGSGLGAVDIYGIDAYPFRYDCGHPYVWPTYRFPTGWQTNHTTFSPSTPFTIMEFEGGSGDGWGGVGEDMCAILVNNEGVRVLFKNNYSFGVTIFNTYMIYGGTNWGNLGYHGGYTSYDYGASITEDRQIWREKYSEMKIQANFFKVSPAYLTATAGNVGNGSFVSTSTIAVTPLWGNGTTTNFYVARHSDFTSTGNASYTLTVSTSIGNVTIPQLGGTLSMIGRDSKIHATDYDVGGINLSVLVLYGGESEVHEFALPMSTGEPKLSNNSTAKVAKLGSAWVINWQFTTSRQVVTIGDLTVYLLWRNEAYDLWVLELPASEPIGNFTSMSKSNVIVKAGYLLRTAIIDNNTLHLTGDINCTTTLELIATPSDSLTSVTFNGSPLETTKSSTNNLLATISFSPPEIQLPDLSSPYHEWKYHDSLPELSPTYNDTIWTLCTHTSTTNPLGKRTPTSLYASDYGFHTGSLLYRGYFTSTGTESTFTVNITGGVGFGHSVLLNSTFLGSWAGSGANETWIQNFAFPVTLEVGKNYVLTVLIDHMGQDEEAPGTDAVKYPRGITDFSLQGREMEDVEWKITGNLGGEQYLDLVRGPRNEGAMFAERMGWHLPSPPSEGWESRSPVCDGVDGAGVGFFTTGFELDVPSGWDVPMSFVFNGTEGGEEGTGGNYRAQLFVNGWQFGKYVNNLGPQTTFPVPEGILNYNGKNDFSLALWSLDAAGAKLGGFALVPKAFIKSGYSKPALVDSPAWVKRENAY
ncbi:putative beta-galactosidase E [Mollisia scopiformis]|uniref:Beta-galactosidase n=1 Tax=Mollisia scopiformis TaxID=149040 RepID=A0A194XGL9_MOLSC|nr:putative beta-galactosidase E [Mollisia scopiformis]KUJ19279.1 putative beta-galactosidase E [Mollisia scopiformis]